MEVSCLTDHQHGKSRVRVGRVWKDAEKHTFVEWGVDTMLESDMAHAFLTPSNEGMTATDTQKNTVYFIAKKMAVDSSPEDFALALARHFVKTYPLVSKAKIAVQQVNWERHQQDGKEHCHGFEGRGTGTRTAYAECSSSGKVLVLGGIKDWRVLKTTQSGYEGFQKDEFTLLQDTKERILATNVTATWKYNSPLPEYHTAFRETLKALSGAFFGPLDTGVYSPSVQFTLYKMADAAIRAVSDLESIYLSLPNLHFLPCKPVNCESFDDDVYVATSEPHGSIEASVSRKGVIPHSRL